MTEHLHRPAFTGVAVRQVRNWFLGILACVAFSSVPPAARAQTIDTFAQCDYEIALGNSGIYPPYIGFCSAGCTVTALAMLLKFYGTDFIETAPFEFVALDPETLNDFLVKNRLLYHIRGHARRRTGWKWKRITNVTQLLGGSQLVFHGSSPKACNADPWISIAQAYTPAPSGTIHCPLPARATWSSCYGHQVLLLEELRFSPSDIRWNCADPGGGVLDIYNNYDRLDVVLPAGVTYPPASVELVGDTRRLLAGEPVAFSAFAGSGDRVLVIDSEGRRSGVDSLGVTYFEIPGTSEGEIFTDELDGGEVEPGLTGVDGSAVGPATFEIRVTDVQLDGCSAEMQLGDVRGNESDVPVAGDGSRFVVSRSVTIGDAVRAGMLQAGDYARLVDVFVVPLGAGRPFVLDADLETGIYATLPEGAAPSGRYALSGEVEEVEGLPVYECVYVRKHGPVGGNTSPVANADSLVLSNGVDLLIPASTLIANDTDADGQSLLLEAAGDTPESHGTVEVEGSSIRYTPDQGFTGVGRLAYSIADGAGGKAAAPVSVLVQGSTGVDVGPRGTALAVRLMHGNPTVRADVELVVEGVGLEVVTVSLYDARGSLVGAQQFRGQGQSLRVAFGAGTGRLDSGLYFVRASTSTRTAVAKVVVLE
jgi:hypothetical protein